MPDQSSGTRLNKFIARHTGISRREADELISSGDVQINGEHAPLGAHVTETDVVSVRGKRVTPLTSATTLLLNKPVGYVCSRRRQGESPTIYELLPEQYHSLKPVGRLDRDSSGLVLLTDDGDFAHSMTHPSFHKKKVYEVTLDKPLQPLHRQMISDFGVMLEDGKSQFELERLHDGDDTQWKITMTEGRNRQIRRTFAAIGYTVYTLHRTNFGQYMITSLNGSAYTAAEDT